MIKAKPPSWFSWSETQSWTVDEGGSQTDILVSFVYSSAQSWSAKYHVIFHHNFLQIIPLKPFFNIGIISITWPINILNLNSTKNVHWKLNKNSYRMYKLPDNLYTSILKSDWWTIWYSGPCTNSVKLSQRHRRCEKMLIICSLWQIQLKSDVFFVLR